MKTDHYQTIIQELEELKQSVTQEAMKEIAAIDRLILRFQDKLMQRDVVPLHQPVVQPRRTKGEWSNQVKQVLAHAGREMTVVEIANFIPNMDSQSLSTRMSGYARNDSSLFYRVPVNKKHFAYGLAEWRKQA